MGEWRTVRLGDVALVNPESRGRDWMHQEIEYIDISSIGTGCFTESPKRMKLSDAPSRAQRIVKDTDTILSTVRPNRRSFLYLKSPATNTLASTGFAVLRATPKIEPSFLYYTISRQEFTDYLDANSHGSAYPAVSPEVIGNAEIELPPLNEQRAIARILGSLDDLIDLNRRTNETLEQIARALFRHYFPYSPDDLPAPGKARQAGDLPEGWRVGTIGDICEFAYGKALKAEDRVEGTIPVYGSNGRVGRHNEALVKGPGIVVGRKGNPGVVTWVQTDFFSIDTTFYVVPKQGVGLHYLFHFLRAAQLNSLGADSAVPGLNRNMAYMSKVVIPPANVLDGFERESAHLSALIFGIDEQSRTLAALRDLLLPKLMSGEIGVPADKVPQAGVKDIAN